MTLNFSNHLIETIKHKQIMNSTVKQFLTFSLGIGAGLLTGYLTAPRSGKKTREKIASDMDEFKTSFEKRANQKLQEAKKILNETVDEQVKRGKDVLDKMKDTVKS